jgi:hypothetical protein
MRDVRCLIGRHDWVVPPDVAGATDLRRTCSRCGAALRVNTRPVNPPGDPAVPQYSEGGNDVPYGRGGG